MCKTQTQYTENVINYKVTAVTGGNLTDLQLLTALDLLIAPDYKNILPTNATYYGTKLQVIKPDRMDPVVTTVSAGAGMVVGDSLPTQVAGVVSVKTGFAAKSKQGRMFMPATGEADSTAIAQPSAGYLAAVATLCNDIFTFNSLTIGPDTVDVAWSVYSRKGGIMTPITSYLVRPNWGTQRRRSQIKHADTPPF